VRLSTTERDCLFQLLTSEYDDVLAGDCGPIPNKRTFASLNRKGLLEGADVDFSGPWDFPAGRAVILQAQSFLDEIDSQGDPSIYDSDKPRMIDRFNF
jgi:hypothetical protein